MGIIRTNEDWDQAMGISSIESKIQKRLEAEGIDYGYCNPIKAKRASELEEEIRAEYKHNPT